MSDKRNPSPAYATVLRHPQRSQKPPTPPGDYNIIRTNGARFERHRRHVNGVDYYRLERDIVFTLNNSQVLRCYAGGSRSICIFDLPEDDVMHLNSLTYQLVRLADLRKGHICYLPPNEDHPKFIDIDRKTLFFNRYSQPIMKTDFIKTFRAKVALSIKGIRMTDDTSSI